MKAPTEKHLEDWIVNNPSHFADCQPGEQFYSAFVDRFIGRQFRLPFGIVDLIGVKTNTLQVIELKKGVIDYASVCQCMRYVAQIKEIVTYAYYDCPDARQFNVSVDGMIVGHSFEAKDVQMIASAAGICTVIYDCNPDTLTYEFSDDYIDYETQISISYADGMCKEYLYGSIGEAIRSIPLLKGVE